MASDAVRKLADNILNSANENANSSISSETFTREKAEEPQNEHVHLLPNAVSVSSYYTLASENSQISGDVDRWIRGNVTPMESTAVQGSRVPVVQRSTLATVSSLNMSGMWYMLALVLPFFSANNCSPWRCSPSLMVFQVISGTLLLQRMYCITINRFLRAQASIISTAELLVAHFGRMCGRARAHARQLAQDQMATDLFATAMDIVLVVYAIGFLVLSMYQASLIG